MRDADGQVSPPFNCGSIEKLLSCISEDVVLLFRLAISAKVVHLRLRSITLVPQSFRSCKQMATSIRREMQKLKELKVTMHKHEKICSFKMISEIVNVFQWAFTQNVPVGVGPVKECEHSQQCVCEQGRREEAGMRARELTQLSLEGEAPAVLTRTMAEGWTRWTMDAGSHQPEQGKLIAFKKQIAKSKAKNNAVTSMFLKT